MASCFMKALATILFPALLINTAAADHFAATDNSAVIPDALCEEWHPDGRCSVMKECENTPKSRACWSKGFSIATDFDEKFPDTGVTRKYHFSITNSSAAPDGIERSPVFLVNGQYIGPTIYADWGDIVEVTIENHLKDNGTGIHWHGIRQWYTGYEDGVPGVTECPLAPGHSKVYRWRATAYGTTWWHSHLGAQYGDGVVGIIIIQGPATANYDEDLGALPVTEWYYQTVAARSYLNSRMPGRMITIADNGLINSTMVSPDGSKGKYYVTKMQRGKRYRLRLINISVDSSWQVSLDGHEFEVIGADNVPMRPVYRDWVFMGIGQRQDVIVTANQTGGSWWFRAVAPNRCGSNNNNGNIASIFRYEDASDELPTSSSNGPAPQDCDTTYPLVPYWNSFVPKEPLIAAGQLSSSIQIGVRADHTPLVQWGINFSAVDVSWKVPVVQAVLNDPSVEFPRRSNLIRMPDADRWYYWVIQEVAGVPISVNLPHPMHLHGHDFYILGTGPGDFSDVGISALQFDNPTRRDTAMLTPGGWLVVAFTTDNPGA